MKYLLLLLLVAVGIGSAAAQMTAQDSSMYSQIEARLNKLEVELRIGAWQKELALRNRYIKEDLDSAWNCLVRKDYDRCVNSLKEAKWNNDQTLLIIRQIKELQP